MKTATITFHAPNNNGSFLQAYALQQILTNEVGVENVIIDYSSDSQIRQYSLLRFPHSVGDLGRNLISLMHYPSLKRRVSRFEEIRKTYLKMTRDIQRRRRFTPRRRTMTRLSAAVTKYGTQVRGIIQTCILCLSLIRKRFHTRSPSVQIRKRSIKNASKAF